MEIKGLEQSTTSKTITLQTDHIAENTGSHAVIFDNFVGVGGTPTADIESFGDSGIMCSRAVSSASGIYLRTKKCRGTFAEPVTLSSGDIVGGYYANGYDGADYVTSGGVVVQATETWSNTAHGVNVILRGVPVTTTTITNMLVFTAIGTDGCNMVAGTSNGLKIGTATNQKIGFYNATPVVQAAHIANPSGGTTIDTQARGAINSILVILENLGLNASA